MINKTKFQQIIEAQDEYISLLEKECARLETIFIVKPYLKPSEKVCFFAEDLRIKIKELKSKIV